jgi:hypothetical protein
MQLVIITVLYIILDYKFNPFRLNRQEFDEYCIARLEKLTNLLQMQMITIIIAE